MGRPDNADRRLRNRESRVRSSARVAWIRQHPGEPLPVELKQRLRGALRKPVASEEQAKSRKGARDRAASSHARRQAASRSGTSAAAAAASAAGAEMGAEEAAAAADEDAA